MYIRDKIISHGSKSLKGKCVYNTSSFRNNFLKFKIEWCLLQ